jgi:hypothetical protein
MPDRRLRHRQVPPAHLPGHGRGHGRVRRRQADQHVQRPRRVDPMAAYCASTNRSPRRGSSQVPHRDVTGSGNHSPRRKLRGPPPDRGASHRPVRATRSWDVLAADAARRPRKPVRCPAKRRRTTARRDVRAPTARRPPSTRWPLAWDGRLSRKGQDWRAKSSALLDPGRLLLVQGGYPHRTATD